MQHIVIHLLKQIVQKLNHVLIVETTLLVLGLKANVHSLQDVHLLLKHLILNVKQSVIDVLPMELIVLKLMLVVLTKSNFHVSKMLPEAYAIGIQQIIHVLMPTLVINYQQHLQQTKIAEM